MNWASRLFVVLLMTDITGTIFFLVGILFGKLTKNDVKFLRFLTEATLCAYLMPFAYIVLSVVERIRYNLTASDFNLFYITPPMVKVNATLGCIWIGLFLVLLAYRLYRRYRWSMICRGNIPEEDEKIFRVFTDICAGLGIDGEVSLCRNDSVNVPCITYYHGFVVILPLIDYTEKDAEVIFCHELCHYLNRDMYLKTVGVIAVLLHAFNPVAHILLKQMDLLCEECCDMAACKKGKDRFTVKEYLQVIFDSLVSDDKRQRYQLFALADDISNYERRVKYMVNYHKHGGLKRSTALVLAMCFLMGSGITALAAGDGVVDAYTGMTKETSVKNTYVEAGAASINNEAIEILSRAYDLDPDKVVMMEDDADPYALIKQVWWTVPPDTTYVSSGMIQDVGDKLNVTVWATPYHEDYTEDIIYQMGVQDPNYIMWYVEGSGTLTEIFDVDIKGTYYFFVTNMDEDEPLDIHAYIIRISADNN